jgi:hypothetical protein
MIAASPLFARADILANENFANGTAHWSGDGHDLSNGSPGIIIQLDPSKWTQVSQTFNTRENALDFSVSFQTSSDFSLSTDPNSTIGQILSVPDLQEMTGTLFKNSIHVKSGSWLLMVVDPAEAMMTFYGIKTTPGSTDVQTAKNAVPRLAAHEEKTIFLAFPPGQGTITLLNIVLTPSAGSTSPSP